jgi:hypothetical protein
VSNQPRRIRRLFGWRDNASSIKAPSMPFELRSVIQIMVIIRVHSQMDAAKSIGTAEVRQRRSRAESFRAFKILAALFHNA